MVILSNCSATGGGGWGKEENWPFPGLTPYTLEKLEYNITARVKRWQFSFVGTNSAISGAEKQRLLCKGTFQCQVVS